MPVRNEEDAQCLQRHALEALTEVKAWVWAHHQLPPGPIVTADEATRHAAYLEWFSRLEAALDTLG
jgi:hypothetical protein